MNLWDFLEDYKSKNNITYKKWLDVKSDHFFSLESFEIPEVLISYSQQRKIAKKILEEYRETGNHLLYLSSPHKVYIHEKQFPIFLTPVTPHIDTKSKKIRYHVQDQFFSNEEVLGHSTSVAYSEIEAALISNTIKDYQTEVPSLYFDNKTRKSIEKDIAVIAKNVEMSHAMKELFQKELRETDEVINSHFFDWNHLTAIDRSQADTLALAIHKSIVISGPPGTGKSQTIINLLFEEANLGRKVAVISEKQAALEVLLTRIEEMGLSHLIFHIPKIGDGREMMRDLESSWEHIYNYKEYDVPYFNEAHFGHIIRTLEDYYNASVDKGRMEKKGLKIDTIEQTIAYWLLPNMAHISLDILSVDLYLKKIHELINELGTDFERLKFGDIKELVQCMDMLSAISHSALHTWLKPNPKKKKWVSLKKKKELAENKISKLSRPDIHISDKVISYVMNRLETSSVLTSWFDYDLKKIEQQLISSHGQWKDIDKIKKIEWLEIQRKRNDLTQEIVRMDERLLQIELDCEWKGHIEILKYIETKLEYKTEIWKWLEREWIYSKHQDRKRERFSEIQSLMSNHLLENNLHEVYLQEFYTEFSRRNKLISKTIWDTLASYNFPSRNAWINYMDDTSHHILEPVLKNYSKRDIIHFVKGYRTLYPQYRKYRQAQYQKKYLQSQNKEWNQLLKSRKPEDKSQKESWKKTIAFIQKKWSEKKKTISAYQYIQALDFDFIQWIKPISILSSEQLSQYTPLNMELYDTIIIDESSQIEWYHALPALYRTKKIIIVGDKMQLTPSRYFRNVQDGFHHGYDNILELAEEKLQKSELKYHYRSAYNNLIAYSNTHFYDNRLIATPFHNSQSLTYCYLPDGRYIHRKNEEESKSLVKYMLTHLEQWKDKSIGIICFSIQQKEAIEDRLEKELEHMPHLEKLLELQKKKSEYFFIKNMENVQGDERDIILISLGYGRNESDRIYQFFGPILHAQGENRLNVLMSRAKEKMILWTSMRSHDIKLYPNSSRGLHLLKTLFSFWENSSTSYYPPSRRIPNNYWDYFLNPFRK